MATLPAADPDGRDRFRNELTRLWQDHNLATDRTTVVRGEFLEVQARVA